MMLRHIPAFALRAQTNTKIETNELAKRAILKKDCQSQKDAKRLRNWNEDENKKARKTRKKTPGQGKDNARSVQEESGMKTRGLAMPSF